MQFEAWCIQLQLICSLITSQSYQLQIFQSSATSALCCLKCQLSLLWSSSRQTWPLQVVHKGISLLIFAFTVFKIQVLRTDRYDVYSIVFFFQVYKEICSHSAAPGSGFHLRVLADFPLAARHPGQWLWAPPSALSSLLFVQSPSCQSCALTGAPR